MVLSKPPASPLEPPPDQIPTNCRNRSLARWSVKVQTRAVHPQDERGQLGNTAQQADDKLVAASSSRRRATAGLALGTSASCAIPQLLSVVVSLCGILALAIPETKSSCRSSSRIHRIGPGWIPPWAPYLSLAKAQLLQARPPLSPLQPLHLGAQLLGLCFGGPLLGLQLCSHFGNLGLGFGQIRFGFLGLLLRGKDRGGIHRSGVGLGMGVVGAAAYLVGCCWAVLSRSTV